ncbi:MAG: hypothetical protein WD270_03810 [Acetobacterales bacterium]
MGQVRDATARLEVAVARLEAAVVTTPGEDDEGSAQTELDELRQQYDQLQRRTGTVAIRLDKAIARLQQVLGED